MSLRKLPEAKGFTRPQNYQWDEPSDVLAKWAETSAPAPALAGADDDATITMFDVIGDDYGEGGVTAKMVSAVLRRAGDRDVTVRINSRGGDMFEGIAIYNMLRQHPAKVTVEIMGWAASAASIIAMAGDEIRMGIGTFMMVHNAWGAVIGNRHDMREAADLFDGFDAAIADIYEARTGSRRADIIKLMDAETFMGSSDAVTNGFADLVDDGLRMPESRSANSLAPDVQAKRKLDVILAKAGVTRSERRLMIKNLMGGMQDAAAQVMHDADPDPVALRRLIETMKS